MFIVLVSLWQGANGQGLFESATTENDSSREHAFTLNGYVRGSAYGAGKNFDYTNMFGEVSLRAGIKKDQFLFNSDIRFRSGYNFNNPFTEVEVKEAYAGYSSNVADLLLGEQIISWGRTDGFNPTNNITPNNYFFFSPEPDDQKISNFLLKTDIRISPKIDWEIIAIPLFKPSVYRYDLFDMGDNVSFDTAVLPERTFKNGSFATKLNFEFPGIGFSASWFRGYDPFYGFDIRNVDFSTGNAVVTYIPSFYQKNSIGLDFSLPMGTWILRGEAAANLTKNDEGKMYIPNSNVSYVAGIEHDFKGFLTIVQYIGQYAFDYSALSEPVLSDPNNMQALMQYASETVNYESALFNRKIFHQQDEMNHALSVTISKWFAWETFYTELTGYYNFTSEEYMIRPKVTWKIGGSLSLSAGYSYMDGPEKSVFSYAAPVMNGAFVEFKVNF